MNVVVAEAARALAERGHEVVAVTRAAIGVPAGDRPLDPGRPEGARLVALPAGDPGLRKEELPGVLPRLARELRELGRFDAVHAHYWLSGIAARPAAAASGVTPVVTFHTLAAQKNARLAPGERPEPELRLAGERALAGSAYVVAGSRSELAGVVAAAGRPPHGAEVIHPGVDTGRFRPQEPPDAGDAVSRETSLAPLRLTVLGRVQPLKGQDLALRAAGELARRDPELWRRCELVIAGEPTPGAADYAAELRALAHRLGIAARVRFLPAQDRAGAAELLAASAIVLVTSHSETFGLVALEAAAAGAPCVVAAHTGLLEAAPAGVAAVHVPDRDPVRWAEAAGALLRDPARRRALARSARAYALRHDWAAHAAKLEARYARLARRGG